MEAYEQDMGRSPEAKAKMYLAATDWVVAKVGEARLLGEDIAPLMAQYESIFLQRKAARLVINGGI